MRQDDAKILPLGAFVDLALISDLFLVGINDLFLARMS